MGSGMCLWSCTDMSVLCTFKYIISWTCMYMIHTNIYIHERAYIMNIQIYIMIFMHMYVQDTYKYVNECTCIYNYYTCTWINEHVYTCLYYVQTHMYYFATSCPGCQDSRWTALRPAQAHSSALHCQPGQARGSTDLQTTLQVALLTGTERRHNSTKANGCFKPRFWSLRCGANFWF